MKWLKVKADSSTVQFLNLARRLFPQGIVFLKIKKKIYISHSNLTRSVCDVLIRLIKLSQDDEECYWDGLRKVKTFSSRAASHFASEKDQKELVRNKTSISFTFAFKWNHDPGRWKEIFFSFSNVRGDWQFVGQTPRLWQRSTRSWGLCIVWRQRSGKIYITIKGLVIK